MKPTTPAPSGLPQSAAEWLGRLNAADCSIEERALFERWLAGSTENREAFARYEQILEMPRRLAGNADMFARLSAQADAAAQRRVCAGAVTRRPRVHFWGAALAAGAASIAVALGVIHFRDSADSMRIATAASEVRTATLSDGSVVTLNSKTTISATFTAEERRVEMKGAEAFFHVSKDPKRPFVVRVGNSEVRVLGTQFNVRQNAGELEVVVREGKVNVVPDSTVAPTANVPRVELTPGNRVRVNTADNQVVVAQIDPERVTSWRTGMIKFDATSLEEVIEDVNRYADKPLVIANDSLRSLPISGRFRVGDTDSVRFLLRERFDVQSVVEGEKIVLR